MFVSISRVLFVVGLSLTLASTARAEPSAAKVEVVGHVPVSYADLDLDKEADARALLGRLQHAAYRACGGNPKHHFAYDTMPRKTQQAFDDCRRNAVSRAVDAISSPTLSRLLAAARKSTPSQ